MERGMQSRAGARVGQHLLAGPPSSCLSLSHRARPGSSALRVFWSPGLESPGFSKFLFCHVLKGFKNGPLQIGSIEWTPLC